MKILRNIGWSQPSIVTLVTLVTMLATMTGCVAEPGVEDYKRNMFALLEKPGYEKETAEIQARLK